MADTIVPFTGVKGFATGVTGTSIADETGAFQGSVVTGFNGATGAVTGVTAIVEGTGISISGTTRPTITNTGVQTFNGLTGAVTGVTTTSANTFTALQTFTAGITASGATFTGQVTVNTFKANTIGGDEGGQIDFGLAATNTSLTGGVAIDVYQNRLRLFETGGNSRGVYIDLTTAANSAGSNLFNKTYGYQTTRFEDRNSGITGQGDFTSLNDFVVNNFSSSISNGPWLLTNANGGGVAISTTYITVFGYDKVHGVVAINTGTTSNATGYSGVLLQANLIPGIPQPSTGYITKYELEARFCTDASVTAQDTKTRIGFADTYTNSTAASGVYFERIYDASTANTETTFQVVFRQGGSEERINTAVTFSASTIYRVYLSVERDTSGNFTTSWEIVNETTNTTTSGTASPSTTARYPSASTAYINPGMLITKTGSTATTTSRYLAVDYIGVRIRRPLNRQMKLFPT